MGDVNIENAKYLGDGLYAQQNSVWEIEVFSYNGIIKTNQVYFGTQEIDCFLDLLQEIGVPRLNPKGDV